MIDVPSGSIGQILIRHDFCTREWLESNTENIEY